MKDLLLTIIIPIYNQENLLDQCLGSFSKEEFVGRLEILAIDDGSEDRSLSIALEYSKRYPQIYKVIHKENGGVGSVMNIGLQNAAGKFIKEVDADDYVYTEVLVKLLDFLEKSDVDIVLTSFEEVNEAGEHLKSHYMKGINYNQEYLLDEVLNYVAVYVPTLTVRKKLLIEHGFTFEETKYYVDMQLTSESIYYATTCAVLNIMLYCYRLNQSEQSVNLKNYVKNKHSFRKQVELSLERFQRAQNEDISKVKKRIFKEQACEYSSMLYIIYLMDNTKDASIECEEFDSKLQREFPEISIHLERYVFVQELRNKGFENIDIYKKEVANIISDLKIINKENVELADVCFWGLNGHDRMARYKMQKQRDKFKTYFHLLNRWLTNYQKGIKVENYLIEKNFYRIAIYGCGDLGVRLYQELEKSKVQVVYGIDQQIKSIDSKLQIYTLQNNLEEIDAIIVTVIPEFFSIMKELKKKLVCPIISLEDIIYRS